MWTCGSHAAGKPGGAPLTVSREQLLPSVRMMYRSALRGQLRGLQPQRRIMTVAWRADTGWSSTRLCRQALYRGGPNHQSLHVALVRSPLSLQEKLWCLPHVIWVLSHSGFRAHDATSRQKFTHRSQGCPDRLRCLAAAL